MGARGSAGGFLKCCQGLALWHSSQCWRYSWASLSGRTRPTPPPRRSSCVPPRAQRCAWARGSTGPCGEQRGGQLRTSQRCSRAVATAGTWLRALVAQCVGRQLAPGGRALRAVLIDEGGRHAAKQLQPRCCTLAVRALHAALGCQQGGNRGDGGGKLQLQALPRGPRQEWVQVVLELSC